MVAVVAMRCKHSPDGAIQWLLLKPRMCSIRWCTLHLMGIVLLPLISLSPITIAKDHVMVHIIWNRVILLFISMSLVFSLFICYGHPPSNNGCRFGSHLQWQASDSSKTRVAVTLNWLRCYIVELYKTPQQHPQPTPSDGRPCIKAGGIHRIYTAGGANGTPWWWCVWGSWISCRVIPVLNLLYKTYGAGDFCSHPNPNRGIPINLEQSSSKKLARMHQ